MGSLQCYWSGPLVKRRTSRAEGSVLAGNGARSCACRHMLCLVEGRLGYRSSAILDVEWPWRLIMEVVRANSSLC